MQISIITTTYNSGRTLRDTFQSMLSQTCQTFELVVVDGKSSDETLDIIREYEGKFGGRMKWVSEKDNGIYDAMNKGFGMASGEVVGFLNSDDLYYDERVVEDIYEAFEDAEVDCIFGDLVYVDANDTNRVVRKWKGSPYHSKIFWTGWTPAHPSFYVRKKFVDELGGFDTNFDVSADFEFMFRYLQKHQLRSKYVARNFVRMRMGGESSGSIRNIWKGNKNIIRAFHKNGYEAGKLYPIKRILPKVLDRLKHKF